MIRIIKVAEDRIDIELNGKLDKDEMKTALDELEDKARDIREGKMLYTVTEFHLPTLSAVIHEFSRLPAMFALIKNFSRGAVLTDKLWLQKAAEMEGMLLPWMKIKAFDLNEREAAEAWLDS
ncbi:MAG: hypothetical protein CMP91_09960 [Gammaproteobacteria bacterium]|nr:hypothetical protein [Gammaproteobacteria bacterium]MAY03754.1 hypothetical protein [Gammaproteobacteria bacterium]|tara:strand:- start:1514 stop:1879 length:366 start_codon:yes stop_codon:yes gene_type:complete